MTRSKHITPLIVASLSLLALPALAQSSSSTPGSSTDPDRPSSSTPGSTSGSVSGSTSSDTSSGLTTPRSSSTTGSSQSAQAGVVGHLNSNFSTIDKDSDGKISQSEFTQQSQAGVSGSASGATPRSGGMSGVSGASGAQYSAEQFRQYDKNSDGYLTRDELNASSNSSSDSSSGSTKP